MTRVELLITLYRNQFIEESLSLIVNEKSFFSFLLWWLTDGH